MDRGLKSRRLGIWVGVLTCLILGLVYMTPVSSQPGQIIARLQFTPEQDGFRFANYGQDNRVWQDDLGVGDLVRMFGPQVCRIGVDAESCKPTAAAQQWLDKQIRALGMGHCEGFSVASLRFYQGQMFHGKQSPEQFQPGAASVFDLDLTPELENYIAYYATLQEISEVWAPTQQIRQTSTPSQILQRLIEGMNSGDPYTLGLYSTGEGKLADGHSVTPFAIEDMGDEFYLIHVYDNNFPGEIGYILLDAAAEIWEYQTSATPGRPEQKYVGDASTYSLDLTLLSLRDQAPFQCPFCDPRSTHLPTQSAHLIEAFLVGEGDILISNSQGQSIGYDFFEERTVNQIPGAVAIPVSGGLGKAVPPNYLLPADPQGQPYEFIVSSRSLTQPIDADLVVVGAGFTVGFEAIQLDPGEDVILYVADDGLYMALNASQQTITPDIFFAIDPQPGEPSYILRAAGITVSADETIEMQLDLEAGQIAFRSWETGESFEFDVSVTRLNPDGSEEILQAQDLIGSTQRSDWAFADRHGLQSQVS